MPEPTTDAPEQPPADTAPAAPEPEVNWQAEADKWKALARKHEDRAKENGAAARELEKLRESSLSEAEKAVAEAEKRGRTAALTEVATRLAAAEIRAALTGVVADPAVVVDDLNLAKFVTADGDVDAKAVTALKDRYAALIPKQAPDLKQGTRQAPPTEFNGNDWLRKAAGVAS
jgi:hypothetical protein